ncbi:DUF2017 domain-containing protein [Agromyces atrinae]|uniref:DUF2017 family protein n=1 Tax=Agromyces atrinae TaxID=592376 RepID=UPI001F589EF1|nr:DUF2017 family protein [Agromyces atrinae]MCI2956627.1 DUF2017 domain-containing protein [Agromyces atrinae]
MIVAENDGGVRLTVEPVEAMMLATLAEQVDTVLITDGDPALDRLLPDAYRDDVSASREFSRYTREGIVESKRRAARAVRDASSIDDEQDDPLTIDLVGDDAWVWLRFLTDLRLILAERLEFDESGISQADDPEDALLGAYEWAGFIQGSMLEVLEAV